MYRLTSQEIEILHPAYTQLETVMDFSEGQIFKGNISMSGGDDGPTRSWIVVSPFNKTHIHSIDDPLDLHCWPLFSAQKGLEGGFLKLIKTDIRHPVVQLQRAKEKFNVSDVHLGLKGQSLVNMFKLLEHAVETCQPYAKHAAGEILAFMESANHSRQEVTDIKKRVYGNLQTLDYQPVS
jgi:hypothetical protein